MSSATKKLDTTDIITIDDINDKMNEIMEEQDRMKKVQDENSKRLKTILSRINTIDEFLKSIYAQ